MKKKQWVWLIIAAAVFALVGVVNVVTNTWRQNNAVNAASSLLDSFGKWTGETEVSPFPEEKFIARVDIDGTIMRESSSGGLLGLTAGGYDHAYLLDYIDRLMECPENAGILLYVNSGGGEMGASDEMYLKLMDYKAATGRPIYAYFADLACSGAYYIAMAADEIWADRNSICVNIGVYISTYDLSGLLEKYGVEPVTIRSGENKGIGLLGEPWTQEHLEIYQSIVDLYYQQFLEVVAAGRGITTQQVKEKDDGREMLAAQALEVELIDGIGRYEEYEAQVRGYFSDAPEIYREERAENINPLSLFLNSALEKCRLLRSGSSELETLERFARENEGITVMAYAG